MAEGGNEVALEEKESKKIQEKCKPLNKKSSMKATSLD